MLKTEIFVLASAIAIFIVVLNLVRLRRLREEYSWIWLAAAIFYLVMTLLPGLIGKVSAFFGITNTITAFTFFSLLFIVQILIHYSVRLSKLSAQMKDVAQQIAILDSELTERKRSLENKDSEESDHTGHQVSEEEPIKQVIVEDRQTER